MFIKTFVIKNFKSFKDVTLHFNEDLNLFTGKNNSGKTTVLEAISLWHECFVRLIGQAKREEKYQRKGDWVLGPSYNKFFPFDQINSVRSPNFEDIFYRRDNEITIVLSATLSKPGDEDLVVAFNIGQSGMNYEIELDGLTNFDFSYFNYFFEGLPNAVGLFYASPVSAIKQLENFVRDPEIKDLILKRESASVLRNRLYKFLKGAEVHRFDSFRQDLIYFLFNSQQDIALSSPSDIVKDVRVVVNFKIGYEDIEKDIALLGSGSLQAIELLLNLYQPGEPPKDLNLILLDEPDSHIHRDMQQRLINVLTRFSDKNQIFLTTHNEALIRSAAHYQLFHLEGNPEAEIKSIDKAATAKIQPHFKGIYPSKINPIIRSIGNITGLDFVNAMEADKLVFVEGEDDARAINILLRQQVANRKKYMFWVLGGISEVFENIDAYKQVFSAIKNGKTLWERSVLVFDKDYLKDSHKHGIISRFEEKLGLKAHSWNSYTFESSVFTDLEKLAALLSLWIQNTSNKQADKAAILTSLIAEYENIGHFLEQRQTQLFLEQCCYRYRNIREKTKELFNTPTITQNDIQLQTLVREHFTQSLSNGTYYQLMTKEDVELVIDKAVNPFGLSFSVETDFIELIKLVNKSLWFDEWDFINSI